MCVLSQLFSSRLPFVPLSLNIYLRMASLHHEKQQEQRQQH